jgi:hypothetical protein
MLITGLNDLAMLRFMAVHGGRPGDGFALFLMGIVAVAALVWALANTGNNQSARN